MLIEEYSSFVRLSDKTGSKSSSDRERIAQYGIASEIGSLVAAIKKKELLESSDRSDTYNNEIVEELGDILWYTVMLAALHEKSALDIVRCDLTSLPDEIEKDKNFRDALDQDAYRKFLADVPNFLSKDISMTFDNYQDIAILTSRTSGRELLHVCLTRLLLYATVMMSHGFPQVEKYMQNDIVRLDLLRSLGMVMWHVSALAKVLGLSLDEIVDNNRLKLNELANFDRAPPTTLHDDGAEVPDNERLPRNFSVSFISISDDKLQMFYNGRPLGDELTDNARDDDGYRFHDCMHLANAAKLGWSPVLRSLMRRKRKYNKTIDDSEDGARAQIVEEAVVKAIHSEGEQVSGISASDKGYIPTTLFTSREQISFSFLKLIKRIVRKLEVEKNKYWEWSEAIVEGHKIHAALRRERQGTVNVNILNRTIEFDERVSPNIIGPVVAIGSSACILPVQEDHREIVANVRRAAILRILGFNSEDKSYLDKLQVVPFDGRISVKATEDVQEMIWNRKIVEFRQFETEVSGTLVCTVLALTWENDRSWAKHAL